MKTYLLVLMVFLAAAARGGGSFGPVRNFPRMGIMFPRLEHGKADPLPLPKAYTYMAQGSGRLMREDRFAPYDLWYFSQCCGRWQDAEGNRMVVGRASHQLPGMAAEHVAREAYALELARRENQVEARKHEQVDEWVATFAGAAVYEPVALALNKFALEEVRFYPCEEPGVLVYAFRPRRVGSAAEPGWFCVVLEAARVSDRAAFRKAFEEGFIGKVALPSRTEKGEGEQAGELAVRRKGEKEPDQPNHPVRVDARKGIENYESWWSAEMDGYIILSDVHTEVGKSLIREMQETMPALLEAYARLVPPLVPDREVGLVRLFQSRDDYVRYVGEGMAWSGGAWMPSRRELVMFQLENREEMMGTLRHEAFHQYLSLATGMLGASAWLNEGHACLFERARVGAKGKVALEEHDARARLLVENAETVGALLPHLMRMDYEAFYDGTDGARRLKYAMAWGLAYYLHKGAPLENGKPFVGLVGRYMEELGARRDTGLANEAVLEGVEMELFQERFLEFWQKRRAAGARYDPLD